MVRDDHGDAVIAARMAQRGQGGFALMAGLAIWVGVSGVTMVALLNMTMTSSRIAATQAESATQLRAIDSAMETAVTQIRMDPDALVGASTGLDDGSCIEPLGTGKSEGLQYRDDTGIVVTVTAVCENSGRGGSRIRDTDMAQEMQSASSDEESAKREAAAKEEAAAREQATAESQQRLSSGKRVNSGRGANDDAAGLGVKQSVRTVLLEAVMTLPNGERRFAGTALIRVSDTHGNGSSVSIDDWSFTPERPFVPPTTTTTTTTTTVKPTTTTTTTATTTTVKPTTTTVRPTTTTTPSSPSPATRTIRVTSDWTSGYCAEVTVTNPTTSSLNWIVDIPIEGQISSFWNGEYTRSGNTLRVRGADWNKTINAGATTGFGFCSNR